MYRRGCNQFKYFQDVTRGNANKDIDNEEGAGECHRVKLYDIDLLSKSTDTKDTIIAKKEEEGPVEKPKTYETYSFSGTFRDEVRRIDLVLVLPETDKPEVKKLQNEFLLSIVKVGLEVEPDPGLMPAHRNLTFIKIHAPDPVLEEYGDKLGVKKYFKHVHLEYIQPKSLCFKNKEKEWISLVRKNYVQPLGYSNSDRSLLVYKILLNLRFGEHQNHFGLKRLLNWNIVSDVYALHDGPYFLTRKQNFSEVNARQILYYNWIGWTSIFKLQPLNLIQEYFGSRIGFFFAFLQFYTVGLAVACLGGILSTAFGVVDQTYADVRNKTCNDNGTFVCPRCYSFTICPFRGLKDYYCFGAKLVNVLDHLLLPVHCLFLVVWASVLLTLWTRKEKYWLWMWEQYHVKNMINTRPEFSINYNKPVQSDDTGLWKYYNSGISRVIRIIASVAFYSACLYYAGYIFYALVSYKYSKLMYYIDLEKLPKDYEKYILVALFTTIVIVISTVYEKICHVVAVFVTRFENHRSVESYDRALAVKLFLTTSFTTYQIFIYYAWMKARLFILPSYYINFKYAKLKIPLISNGFQRTCGPNPCIDELFVALSVCFLIKQGLPKMIYFLIEVFWPIRTDYNQGKKNNKKYPCWEREYRLKSITEDRITRYYNYLALQLGYIILFGAASPLLPVAAFVLNLIEIRLMAREFLLTCRRPLLLEKSGLDIWSTLFTVLAWSSILSNAILLGWNTRTASRHVYLKTHDNMTDFFSFTITSFPTSMYKDTGLSKDFNEYTGFKPDVCHFLGLWYTKEEYKKITQSAYFYYRPDFIPATELLQTKIYQSKIIIMFHYVGLVAVILVRYLIPPKHEDIDGSIRAEQNLKDAYLLHSEQ